MIYNALGELSHINKVPKNNQKKNQLIINMVECFSIITMYHCMFHMPDKRIQILKVCIMLV